ncbi:MAG: NADH-quinone oxidoreductase subunit C [Candidatus Brocadiia bacterium]
MSEAVVEDLRQALGEKIQELTVHSDRRIYIDVAPEDLVEAARALFEGMGARYAIASGMETVDGFEVLHHFAFDSRHVLVSLRVRTDAEEPVFDSLAPMIEGASFIEREMRDLLGIEFRGHPNPERLILSDDWPEGVYPLRRGKPWEGKVRKEV